MNHRVKKLYEKQLPKELSMELRKEKHFSLLFILWEITFLKQNNFDFLVVSTSPWRNLTPQTPAESKPSLLQWHQLYI